MLTLPHTADFLVYIIDYDFRLHHFMGINFVLIAILINCGRS